MKTFLGIDIGSTWTKGALFEEENGALTLSGLYRTPTTVDDLCIGFDLCRDHLDPEHKAVLSYSSSAKGGLRIAAIGVVPELTLKMAREAACSAGGKICSVTAYKLCSDDIKKIQESDTDIILFTGGTDGGNEDCVRHNLEMIAALTPEIPVIYAGNRALKDEVESKLKSRDLVIVGNVLPDLNHPDPYPARDAIRELFLKRIVAGRGLDKIVNATGCEPVPTPLAVLELLEKLHESEDGNFAVVDLGGATTDFYSACDGKTEAGVMLRGLPEPPVKRSVEGDVGMRVSARAAFEENQREIEALYGKDFTAEMEEYINKISADTSLLPENQKEREFDLVLAAGCCTTALRRHAGTQRMVFTSSGPVAVQNGRDLRKIRNVIATGGFLSRMDADELQKMWWSNPINPECELLTPQEFTWSPDRDGIMVLIANVARELPGAAIDFLKSKLIQQR